MLELLAAIVWRGGRISILLASPAGGAIIEQVKVGLHWMLPDAPLDAPHLGPKLRVIPAMLSMQTTQFLINVCTLCVCKPHVRSSSFQ